MNLITIAVTIAAAAVVWPGLALESPLAAFAAPTNALPAAVATASPAELSTVFILQEAIEHGAPAFNDGRISECVSIYEEAASKVLALSPEKLNLVDRASMKQALETPAKDASERAWNLRRAFDRAIENESFQPLREAPLPEGFPSVGPIGRVVEKTYPAYRAATAAGGRGSFWSLFTHIQKSGVAMTAPVEMTLGGEMEIERMAFLYEKPGQGKAGEDGAVHVQDLPAIKVLSIAMRGDDNRASIAMAKSLILETMQAKNLKADGPWRVMGYNSPMVSAARRVWELQVPVRPAQRASPGSPSVEMTSPSAYTRPNPRFSMIPS